MSEKAFEPPLNRPVLPGDARSDYERYLNTDELLALQKSSGEWVHRDELLFQVVHQSSELWLKLAWNDTAAAAELVAEALIELDEWLQTWRIRHYRVVARVIGERVVGTQGTPVEVLGRLIHRVEYPELWDVRNELTAKSQAEA
jgi:tryptophan 2,3-dioxygenase